MEKYATTGGTGGLGSVQITVTTNLYILPFQIENYVLWNERSLQL